MRITTDHNTFLGNHLPAIRAVYTRTDLILDAITVLLVVSLWGITLWLHSISPDIIPNKFNLSGEAISWGNKDTLYISIVIITLIGIISLGMTYLSSRYFKYPVPVNVRNHFVIHHLTVVMSKCICLLIILSVACSEFMQIHSVLGISPNILSTLSYLLLVMILVIILGFMVVMRNRKKSIN